MTRLNKRKKKAIRLSLAYLGLIILLSVLAYSYRWVDNYLQNKITSFELREIEINGIDILTRADVLRICGLKQGDQLLTIRPPELVKRLNRSPYVRGVSVVRSLPAKLRVTIVERKPVAFIYGRGLNLIDEEGILIPVPRDNHYWSLPFITGIKTSLGSLGERTTSLNVLNAVQVINYINFLDSGLREAVAEVNIDQKGRLKLRLIKGGAEVRLDKDHFTENLFVLSKYFDLYLAWDELKNFQYLDVRFDGQLIIRRKES